MNVFIWRGDIGYWCVGALVDFVCSTRVDSGFKSGDASGSLVNEH